MENTGAFEILPVCNGDVDRHEGAEKHKGAAGAVCGGIFVLTYVPLMKKFFDVCREEKEIEGEEWL